MTLLAALADIATPSTPTGWLGWAVAIVLGALTIIQRLHSNADENQQQTIGNLEKTMKAYESRLELVEAERDLMRAALSEEIEKRSRLEGKLEVFEAAGISDRLGSELAQLLSEISKQQGDLTQLLREMAKHQADYHTENREFLSALKTMLETALNLEIQDISEGKPPVFRSGRPAQPSAG